MVAIGQSLSDVYSHVCCNIASFRKLGKRSEQAVFIRRNIVRGGATTPRTTKSAAPVPIIEPCRTLLRLWRTKCQHTGDGGWVFEKNLQNTARLRIIPVLDKAELPGEVSTQVDAASLPNSAS